MVNGLAVTGALQVFAFVFAFHCRNSLIDVSFSARIKLSSERNEEEGLVNDSS